MTTTPAETTPAWMGRTALLLGNEKLEHLQHAHVLVVGVGGVGAYAAEMICRAGVGEMTIMDADTIQPSNINRQLPATHATIGKFKTEVLRERFLQINPELNIHVLSYYLTEDKVTEMLEATHYDFIIDAIDTIAPKCRLILEAHERHIPIVSSMGAGAKSDITKIQFADLWNTYHCGLSKAVRTRLKKEGFHGHHPVVFSTEQADRKAVIVVENERNKKSTAGTISYMPAVFGCYLAEYVIQRL